MKAYRVNYRVSNKKQWEGQEPWSDVKEAEVVEADSKEEAIIFLIDHLSESARNNGYKVEINENEQNIKIFDEKGLIEVYDLFEVKTNKTSSAVKNRYNKKTYDNIHICTKKGEKEKIKAAAEKCGESVNAYILRLINEDMGKNS